MDTNQLQSMTIVQLRVLAKEKGVHSPTTLNKAQLIQKLSEKLNSETPAVTQHEYPADSFKQDAGSINDASLSYSDQDDHTARNIPHIQEQQVNNYNSENTPPSQTDSNPTEENAPGQYSYAPGRQAYRPNYKNFNGRTRTYNHYNRPNNNIQRPENAYYNKEYGTSNPAVPEMLNSGECGDCCGILDIHNDGYGFLRATQFKVDDFTEGRDVYVSIAQIRRFCLRTGDLVRGKTRPVKELSLIHI